MVDYPERGTYTLSPTVKPQAEAHGDRVAPLLVANPLWAPLFASLKRVIAGAFVWAVCSHQVTQKFCLRGTGHLAIHLELNAHKHRTVSPELPGVVARIRSRLRCKHSLEIVFAHFDLTCAMGRGQSECQELEIRAASEAELNSMTHTVANEIADECAYSVCALGPTTY